MPAIGIYGTSDDTVIVELNGEVYETVKAHKKGRAFAFMTGEKVLDVHISREAERGWIVSTSLTDDKGDGDLPFDVAILQNGRSPMLLVSHTGPITMTRWDDKRPRTKTFAAAEAHRAADAHIG